jgi:hypothetical protein
MSTHCGIAVKTEKGYETIYCHHDGYPEYMWPMLTTNYNSEELAAELVDYGDASCICERLRPTEFTHSFELPEKDVCVFYNRDRGENWDDVAPTVYTSKELFSCFYYSYVWEDGCWNFYRGGEHIWM